MTDARDVDKPKSAWVEAADERRDRIAELPLKGLTAREIAQRMGISMRTVTRARGARGVALPSKPPHPPEVWARLEQLVDEGCSIAEAARTVGVNEHRVYTKLKGRSHYARKDGSMLRDLVRGVDKIPVRSSHPALNIVVPR